ncbi:hypothetical protein evm_015062 [Chilo suppressalis]|nr:hypothetical protein evm_015062 [Chilo suppressalis]
MVRGAGRGGRGMPGRGGMGRPPFNRPRVLMLRPPFDLILAEPAFPRCKPAPDDSALTQALLKRHAELCPTPAEQSAVLSLVTKLQSVLDNLVVAPGDFAACQLEEVRQVGSYKKGTMMAGKNVADIVVIMKTLPTKEAVEGLSNKVNEEVNKLMVAESAGCVTCACHERGFTVTATGAAVRVLVTTLHQNLRKLEPDARIVSSSGWVVPTRVCGASRPLRGGPCARTYGARPRRARPGRGYSPDRTTLADLRCRRLTVATIPTRTKKFGDSFLCRAIRKWNALPAHVFPPSYNLGSFKRGVKKQHADQQGEDGWCGR